MDDTRTEIEPTGLLKRYSVTIPEEVVIEAISPMRERHVRSFSDYVTRLIQEDLIRTKSGKSEEDVAQP